MSRKNTFLSYTLIAFLLPFMGWGGDANPENDSSNLKAQEDRIRNDLINQIDPEILQICPEIRNLSEYALCCIDLVGCEIVKSVLNIPELVEEFKKSRENTQNKFDEKGFIASIYIVYQSVPKSSDKNKMIDRMNIDANLDFIIEQIMQSSQTQ